MLQGCTSGGQVSGNNSGALSVGRAIGGAGSVVNATGTVHASAVSGFSSYSVGMLTGAVGAGSVAQGTVIGSGVGVASSTGPVSVGFLGNTSAAATASGVLSLNDSLLINAGALQVGQMFLAGRGSTATGQVTIGDDAGTVVGFLIAGNVTSNTEAQVGSSATGQIGIGGNLDLAPGTGIFIGTTLGFDQAIEGADTFINQASGSVSVGGTLRFLLDDPGFVGIGQTSHGAANGSFAAGALDMGSARIDTLSIGVSNSGQATGAMSIGGGELRVGNLNLGSTTSGSADGTLMLQTANFVADNVLAGIGLGGSGRFVLQDSTATITDGFTLSSGELLLDDSFMTVANAFTLGGGATLTIDIDGLLRGGEYGAIDAGLASLAGVFELDLADLLFVGNTMVFDLIRSIGLGGISGDFDSVIFTGLQDGYSAFAGIELDDGEIYRLRITRQAVPEPATLSLLLSALIAALIARGGRPARPWRIKR